MTRTSARLHVGWRWAQCLVALLGAGILAALIIAPRVGIDAFWNVLIPVAPALLVIAPGLWRNVCPLATAALLPRHFGVSRGRRLSLKWQGHLCLLGVLLLFLLLPLRHILWDRSGPATAFVLVALAALAVLAGSLFDWKSAWCAGICPVHPVEKLYGSRPLASFANAHCSPCAECSTVCPDSTPSMDPTKGPTKSHRLAATLLVGGFPGYIWAWFQIPDYAGAVSWSNIGWSYALPLLGAAITLLCFSAVDRIVTRRQRIVLVRVFAAAAVSCYYWFRLPALIGFGVFPGDGMLVDLSGDLAPYVPQLITIATTAFFAWWLVIRLTPRREWLERPARLEKVASGCSSSWSPK